MVLPKLLSFFSVKTNCRFFFVVLTSSVSNTVIVFHFSDSNREMSDKDRPHLPIPQKTVARKSLVGGRSVGGAASRHTKAELVRMLATERVQARRHIAIRDETIAEQTLQIERLEWDLEQARATIAQMQRQRVEGIAHVLDSEASS